MSDGLKIGAPGLDQLALLRAGRDASQLQNAASEVKKGTLSPAEQTFQEKKVKEAAEQFEALLLHQMFKEMWSAVPSEGMLTGSREEQFFRDMFNEALSKDIAAGQGLGIKGIVAGELKEKK